MISKPTASCPRCGGKLTVLDAIDVSRYAESVTYYCECDCGAANLTVTKGKITDIIPRDPIEVPDEGEVIIGSLEEPDYMYY